MTTKRDKVPLLRRVLLRIGTGAGLDWEVRLRPSDLGVLPTEGASNPTGQQEGCVT
jgi:hypothetical protein